MRVLAIDTPAASARWPLLEDDTPRGAAELGGSQEHAERVLGAVERLLAAAAWRPADLELVVASLGPGSFTGVRVGLAAAQGLAFGLGCPVVGVSALELLAAWAERVTEAHGALYVPLLDARRGELYAQAFRPGAAGEPPRPVAPEPVTVTPAALLEWLAPALPPDAAGPVVLCGDGVPLAAGELRPGALGARPVVSVNAPRPPDAAALLARLGQARFRATGAPPLLEPLYVRPPDARRPAVPPVAPGREA